MTKQDTEKRAAQEELPAQNAATITTKIRRRPVAGFIIAGASLALLFGLAALKGRVEDNNTDSERGLD